MISKRTSFAAIAAALSIISIASAATIVDFKPLPNSPADPEFVFDRALGGGIPVLRSANGAIGNGDGTLPIVNQTPGGLLVEVPFLIGGVPGSQFTATSTLFFDSTLLLTSGLAANAPASNPGVFIQQLSAGGFDLLSTDPDGVGPLLPSLLLRGTIGTASFIVGSGNSGAAFNASGVNYTAGLVYTALLASGGNPNNNSMSISMSDVSPAFGIAPDGYLNNFTANATGLFNGAVPEPASLVLLATALGALLLRRR